VDYFGEAVKPVRDDTGLASPESPRPVETPGRPDDWIDRSYVPNYHVQRLKSEMMRSKRYSHALSAILLDIDGFHTVNERYSYRTGNALLKSIVNIMQSTVRAVDILTRCGPDWFLIILPSTNAREAKELAERLRCSIAERTSRLDGSPNGATVTLSVGQCERDDSSAEFMRKLETALSIGKTRDRNAVYET
jgi:diguanylate cyclase (GGDEF)-like protein